MYPFCPECNPSCDKYKCFIPVHLSQSSNLSFVPGIGSHDTGENNCTWKLSLVGQGNRSSLSSVTSSLSSPLNFQTCSVTSVVEVTTAYVLDSRW